MTLTPVDHALNGVVHLERTLGAGFTTIRNTGGDPEVAFSLRRGVGAGKIDGPRILAAGAGGSDGDNAREFELIVSAGMSETEAIVAATVTAARYSDDRTSSARSSPASEPT